MTYELLPLVEWRERIRALGNEALVDFGAKLMNERLKCEASELNWLNQLAALVEAEKARRFNDLLMELQDAKVNAAYQRRELEKAKTMARIETLECFAAKL